MNHRLMKKLLLKMQWNIENLERNQFLALTKPIKSWYASK